MEQAELALTRCDKAAVEQFQQHLPTYRCPGRSGSTVDKNFLFVRRRIRESGLYVKLNFHAPYCVWRLGAEFLDETGVKAEVFWRGI
jgi:hypothetical protein